MASQMYRGRIRVDESGRVTLLDKSIRERIYRLYKKRKPIEVVIRDPDNAASLTTAPEPNAEPDAMCPC